MFLHHSVNSLLNDITSKLENVDYNKINVNQLRNLYDEMLYLYTKDLPKVPNVKETNFKRNDGSQINLRCIYPDDKQQLLPCLIFIHGGGWCVNKPSNSDLTNYYISKSANIVVVSVEYRLAPEHVFPSGLNDVIDAIQWISKHGNELNIDTNKLAIAGESSGANLVLCACLKLRNNKNLLKTAILLSGCYWTDLSTQSHEMFGNGDYYVSNDMIRWCLKNYLSNNDDYVNPDAWPLYRNDLNELPPLYVVANSIDPFKDHSFELVTKLRQNKQEYFYTEWPGTIHGLYDFILAIPELKPQLDEICTYIRTILR